jgi:hypothetical protein
MARMHASTEVDVGRRPATGHVQEGFSRGVNMGTLKALGLRDANTVLLLRVLHERGLEASKTRGDAPIRCHS